MSKRIGMVKGYSGLWSLMSVDVSSEDMVVRLSLMNAAGKLIREIPDTSFEPVKPYGVGDIVVLDDSDGKAEFEVLEYNVNPKLEYEYILRQVIRKEFTMAHSSLRKVD